MWRQNQLPSGRSKMGSEMTEQQVGRNLGLDRLCSRAARHHGLLCEGKMNSLAPYAMVLSDLFVIAAEP